MSLVVKIFGRAFQVYDDVVNLVGENFGKMKNGLGADITEGKLSYPVVYCLSKYREQKKKMKSEPNLAIARNGKIPKYLKIV